MASAVIASRNESSWGQSFMGKIPFSNPHMNPNPNPKPQLKPKPKPKSNYKKKHLQAPVNGRLIVNNPAVVKQAASDDAYSFNQGTIETNNGFDRGGYVSYNVGTYSRSEINELRKKLVTELEQIRKLNDRIESGQINPRLYSSQGKFKKLSGNKRSLPFGSSNKDPKKLNLDPVLNNVNVLQNEGLMKMCKQLLMKLMKHKLSWVFNKPVDAAALGLHDYHLIVKRPMDLGTVKSNLGKNLYASPLDFAADVRLTFNNAMLYNPKTDEVHGMADLLSGQFEEMFKPIQAKIGSHWNDNQQPGGLVGVADEVQGSSWDDIRTPERQKKVKSSPARPISSKQNHSSASNASNPPSFNPPSAQSPFPTPSPSPSPSPVRAQPLKPSVVKSAIGKLPKPKAKDPNKREMSLEEKQKLGLGLQSLPQEKMPQLVQIIKKRNEHLAQEGDEIELDIEALDTETLWELDRFVTNWKKFVSKTKRQALLINNSSAPASSNIDNFDMDEGQESEKADEGPKKNKKDEEDVDIGDDTESSFPPVEIEKDDGAQVQSIPQGNGNASSSSSSSSSGSSSSSDSDSGSSSGSDSDTADEAQS